jgi:hypothetical protein
LRKKNEKVAGVFPLPPYFYEIPEKAQKSLREQKIFFQSSLYRGEKR